MPTAERPKAMHVQNMIFCLATFFLLAAAFVWATYDPDMTSGESSELMEAYNSYNSLYQQGRYSEAEPYAKEALKLVTEEFGPNDLNTAALLDKPGATLPSPRPLRRGRAALLALSSD